MEHDPRTRRKQSGRSAERPDNSMQREIDIWNGSGWNNYQALRELKNLPRGTKGLMAANKIARVEIAPRDSEKPFGIAARFYDADGDLRFTLGFDQNDSAGWIRERVIALLEEGIENRIAERRKEIAREEFAKKIKAWRSQSAPIAPHRPEPSERVRGSEVEELRRGGLADADWRDARAARALLSAGCSSMSKGHIVRALLCARVKTGLPLAAAVAAVPRVKAASNIHERERLIATL